MKISRHAASTLTLTSCKGLEISLVNRAEMEECVNILIQDRALSRRRHMLRGRGTSTGRMLM